jgi:hypothetical protein
MYVEGNISARERVEAAPSKHYDNLSKDLMKEIADDISFNFNKYVKRVIIASQK